MTTLSNIFLGVGCLLVFIDAICEDFYPKWGYMRYLNGFVGGAGIAFCMAGGFTLAMDALADEWTTGDTVRQAVVVGLFEIDREQTLQIKDHPGQHETNSYLGEHPSDQKINEYFIQGAIFHSAVAYFLPRGWREGWQYIQIGIEAGAIDNNFTLGLRGSL